MKEAYAMTKSEWERWLTAYDAVRAREANRPVACREAVRLVLGVEPTHEVRA